MNKRTNLLLVTLLGFSSTCFSMKKGDVQQIVELQTTVPTDVMNDLGITTPATQVKIPKNKRKKEERKLLETDYEKAEDHELCAQFGAIAAILCKEESSSIVAQHPKRAEQKLIYETILKRVNRNKHKAKEVLCGYADDLSDDESDLDALKNGKGDEWPRLYKNSKKKTNIKAAIQANQTLNAAEIIRLEASEESHNTKMKNLETAHKLATEKLEAALKLATENFEAAVKLTREAKEADSNSMKEQLRIKAEFANAIVYHTKRQDQNETTLKERRDFLTKEISAQDKEIFAIDATIKSLLAATPVDNEKLNNQKKYREEDLEKKKKLEAELVAVNYRLPKINQPESYTSAFKSFIGF
jgi:hypothetical protein